MATSPVNAQPSNHVTVAAPPIPQENKEEAAPVAASLHPHDQYYHLMLNAQKMNADGSLQSPNKERFVLSKTERGNIPTILHEKQEMGDLEWDLNYFLQNLLQYFSTSVKGTQVTVTSGALYLVGKKGWCAALEERLKIKDLEKNTSPEIWNFCAEAPDCIEIYFCLSQGVHDLEMFLDLCTYFIVIQAFPKEPLSYVEAICEFGYMKHLKPQDLIEDRMVSRILKIKKSIAGIKNFIKRENGIFEVPFNKKRLKIVFSRTLPLPSLFQCENLRLKLFHNDGPGVEIDPADFPLEALNDLLLHRLVPLTYRKSPITTGLFWAYLTLQGRMLCPRDDFFSKDSIIEAFNTGKAWLGSGKDQLLGFCFHAIHYGMPQTLALEFLKDFTEADIQALTPLGRLLYTNICSQTCKEMTAALTLASALQFYLTPHDSNAPLSRPTTTGIEVANPSSFYLVFPDHLESALIELSTNKAACLSDALSIFFPTLTFKDEAPKRELKEKARQELQNLYKTLRSQEPFAKASLLCFLALQKTGQKIEEDDILALPYWLSIVPLADICLEGVFKSSPFNALFLRIKDRLSKEPVQIRRVCLEELIVSEETKLVPRAWADLRTSLNPSQYVEFMQAILSRLSVISLPIVASGLGQGCSPVEQVQLLSAYLNRLLLLPDQQLLAYRLSWIEQIDTLLAQDSTLKSALLPYPQVAPLLQHFAPKASAPPADIDTLFSEKDPEKLWDQLQKVQESSDQYLQIAEHLQNILPLICTKEGFSPFFEWLARGLAKKKEYSRILSLLRPLPIGEMTLQWLQLCVRRLIKRKASIEEHIKHYREGALLERLPSPFLLRVLQYLIQTNEARVEIEALIDAINPENGESPLFAKAIITYYQTVETRFAEQLIAGISKRLTLLKTHQRAGLAALVTHLESALVQAKDFFVEKEPEQVWNLLLSLREIVQESGAESSQAFVERALSSTQLSSCKGFTSVMQEILQELKEKGQYLRILCLLQYIPILKNDKIFHPWYPLCLKQLIDQKASTDEIVEAVEILHKTLDYVTNDLLLDLLDYLLKKCQEDKKTKDEKVRREINFLKDHIKPTPAIADRFAGCLLTYYPLLPETGHTTLIEDLTRHFSLSPHLMSHVIPAISKLLQTPKDEVAWKNVSALMDHLKESAVETALSIFEMVTAESFLASASIRDAPFQIFKKGLAKFASKLSDPQKARLRKAIAAFTLLAKNEKKEAEFIGFFPSLDWLFSLLKDKETSQTYAALFLEMASKGKVDPKHATFCPSMLWMAPHLLGASLLPFRTQLIRIPQKELKANLSEWTRIIAGVVSVLPVDTISRNLIQTLTEMSSGDEKRFFDRCRSLCTARDHDSLQRDLGVYHKTGTIPAAAPKVETAVPSKKHEGPAISSEAPVKQTSPAVETAVPFKNPQEPDISSEARSKIEALLKQPSLTNEVLTLLEKYPRFDDDLWEKFFLLMKHGSTLAPRAWKIWLAKHPVRRVTADQGKGWLLAIERTLGLLEASEIGVFNAFFIHHLAILLDKLSLADCQQIGNLCLKIAINSSWDETAIKCEPQLKAIHALFNRESLKNKHIDSSLLLDDELRTRFALLSVQAEDLDIQALGHSYCISLVTMGLIRETNEPTQQLFLKNYSEKPYVPKGSQNQEIFYRWLERSWKMNPYLLSWKQACNLLQTLCKFEAVETFNPDAFYEKWVAATLETEGRAPYRLIQNPFTVVSGSTVTTVISTVAAHPLFEATRFFLNKLLEQKSPISLERKIFFLTGINRHLKIFIEKHSLDRLFYIPIILYHASCVLKEVVSGPGMKENLTMALKDIITYLPPFAAVWNSDCTSAVTEFISSLPGILNLAADDREMMKLILGLIDDLMDQPRIRKEPPESDWCWTHLLFCICCSIPTMPVAKRKIVCRAAAVVFSCCTQPALVKKKKNIPLPDQKDLIRFSSQILAFNFLALPELECLEHEDWDVLFNGLSEPNIRCMVTDLLKENDPLALLSLARILRYAPLFNMQFISFLHFHALEIANSKIPAFDKTDYLLFQLQTRAQFIQTLDVLSDKLRNYKEIKKPEPLIHALYKQRERLTLEFVQLCLKHASEENLLLISHLLIEIVMTQNLKLLQAIHENFQIPASTPAELIPKLQLMKARIEKGIADLS